MSVPLPDPATLHDERRREMLERTALVVVRGIVWGSLPVGLAAILAGATWLGWSPTVVVSAVVAQNLCSSTVLFAAKRWRHRRARAAAPAVRALLGVSTPSAGRRLAVALLLVAGLAAVSVVGKVAGLNRVPNGALALLFATVALVVPGVRRWREPRTPRWVLWLVAGWMLAAAGVVVGAAPLVGEAPARSAGWLLTLLAPFGPLGLALRRPLASLLPREDAWGRAARAIAPLSWPAARAQGARLTNGPGQALEGLRDTLGRHVGDGDWPDLLHEVAACLAALGDPRAEAVHRWAAHLAPDDPRPFLALARRFADDDPVRALAYARFAEDCQARALTGTATGAAELRAALEAGHPERFGS